MPIVTSGPEFLAMSSVLCLFGTFSGSDWVLRLRALGDTWAEDRPYFMSWPQNPKCQFHQSLCQSITMPYPGQQIPSCYTLIWSNKVREEHVGEKTVHDCFRKMQMASESWDEVGWR